MNRRYLIDLAERIAATAAAAGIGYAITAVADLDPVWSLPLTVALTAAKGWLARYVGRADSASLVPDAPTPTPIDG